MKVEDNSEIRFVLRADGRVHTSDLRYVSSAGEFLFTASRDSTAMIIPASVAECITPGLTLVGHTSFVNFALYHPSIPLLGGEACVVTGSNDTHVALWNPATIALEAVLDGHAHGVCCGAVLSPAGDIVTGDWGGVCVVFDGVTGAAKLCYDSHRNAVRAVAQLPGTSTVVTASGDKTVHHWDAGTGTTLGVYAGHTDVVQAVCAISATRFSSGGNDATIIIWDTTCGTAPLFVLAAHESLVYSLFYCEANGLLLSASEDRTVKVWRGACAQDHSPIIAQNINHPCVVWSVCAVGSGDIATGGADGFLRLWTLDQTRIASNERLMALQTSVAAQAVDVKVAASAGLDPAALPTVEGLLQQRGPHEGARRFARGEKGAVEVYVWSIGRWEKVGTVVEGPDGRAYTGEPLAKEKKYHKGVPYDYLFDVDVSGRMLKLGYNAGQSVFDAAQIFINENSGTVSQDDKEEIQNFILRSIDPGDVARLTAGQTAERPNAGAQSSGGAGEALFSAFAREAAAMRAAGVGHTPSWTEALHKMEAAGAEGSADIAFSGYAREGILLQQQQQQQQQQVTAESLERGRIAAWDSFKLFTAFNAAGAERKINELTNDPSAGAIVARVQSSAAGGPDLSVLRDIIALYDRLPPASRFPALDLLSHLFCCAAQSPRRDRCGALLLWSALRRDGPMLPFIEQRAAALREAPDAEAMLTARAAAHVLAALGLPDREGTAENVENVENVSEEEVELLLCIATRVPQSLMRATSANVRAAAMALLRNAAVLLARRPALLGADRTRDATHRVVRLVAQWLIFEPADSPCTRELLATVLTLLQAEGTAAATAEVSRTALTYMMRTMRASSEPNISEAATVILNACKNEEAP